MYARVYLAESWICEKEKQDKNRYWPALIKSSLYNRVARTVLIEERIPKRNEQHGQNFTNFGRRG